MTFLTLLTESFETNRPIDDKLILQIAEGRSDALKELYDTASLKVYGFVLSVLKNKYDAEDVLQETFLTVYEKAGQYRPQGKPLAWILVIAKNLALAKLREKNKITDISDEEREIPFVDFDFKTPEQRQILELAFKAITDEEREILMLHAVSGMKHREIAKILELPLNTVLSKFHRAVRKMKKEIIKGETV